MSYVEGFVAAVPAANKAAYIQHAANAAPCDAVWETVSVNVPTCERNRWT